MIPRVFARNIMQINGVGLVLLLANIESMSITVDFAVTVLKATLCIKVTLPC